MSGEETSAPGPLQDRSSTDGTVRAHTPVQRPTEDATGALPAHAAAPLEGTSEEEQVLTHSCTHTRAHTYIHTHMDMHMHTHTSVGTFLWLIDGQNEPVLVAQGVEHHSHYTNHRP